MINRNHRFHGRGSLRFVYQHGKMVRSSFGALRYVRNPRRKNYRLAVVVSRKVHKSAVVRNRIRRRLYEAVRVLENQISEPYDMVYVVYSEQLAEMDSPELRKKVKGKLEEAGVIPKSDHTEKDIRAIVDGKE